LGRDLKAQKKDNQGDGPHTPQFPKPRFKAAKISLVKEPKKEFPVRKRPKVQQIGGNPGGKPKKKFKNRE